MTAPRVARVRTGGLVGIAAGLIAAGLALFTQLSRPAVPVDDTSFPFTPTLFVVVRLVLTLVQLGVLVLVAALSMSGAAGRGSLPRTGLAIALVGFAALVLTESASLFGAASQTGDVLPTAVVVLSAVATLGAAAGLVLAGTGVLRERRWTGWRGYSPTALGVATALLVPLVVAADTRNWATLVWGLLVAALGLAVATSPQPAVRGQASRSSIPQRWP